MKADRKKITPEETERILDSIDGMQRAEMPAFFYTRLLAKLGDERGNTRWQLAVKPAFSIAVLSMLLILNIAAINMYYKNERGKSTDHPQDSLQGFAEEYSLNGSSYYTDKNDDHELLQPK